MSKMIVQDFKAGERAVYPAHGVGMIMGVESRDVSGINKAFYILKILDTEATIMVPTETASTVGLRKIVKSRWSLRYTRYSRTGKRSSSTTRDLEQATATTPTR